MIKHIVMWQVKEHEVHGNKEEIIAKMKAELEGLKGKIEGLVEIEVGKNYNISAAAYDVVLYSTFTSKEALEGYQNHPLHVAIGQNLVRQVAISRIVVDYES
ncbi:Dabb family protein [Cellulosilyticum ruminicola]|uniref:Dabb family protein n=1 Tax=Cellulosilyticum ruminicola TaxID=425254 RepID=UPI0006CFEEC4|nr:Dabb family protein [Cellulosilyticum ruminicola]